MAEVDVTNEKGYLAEAVTQKCFGKQRPEKFDKAHKKTPVEESFFSPWA